MIMEFNLYKVMAILTIIFLTIAAIGTIDFSDAASIDEIINMLSSPLELKNWHYALIAFLIWIKQ